MNCDTCNEPLKPGVTGQTCPECLRVILTMLPDEDEVPDEPEDEDLVTKDRITFYRAGMGRVAFVVPRDEAWQPHAKAYMEKTQYWPNVWLEEERGGYTNITMEGP